MTEMLFYHCATCGSVATACPDCVVCIPVDPETGLPPDRAKAGNGEIVAITPDPAAVARAVKHPICDQCVMRSNDREFTAERRHERDHAPWLELGL